MSKITQEFKDWLEEHIEEFKKLYIYPKSYGYNKDLIPLIECPKLGCPEQYWECHCCLSIYKELQVASYLISGKCPCGLIESGELEAEEFLKAVRNIIEKGETP